MCAPVVVPSCRRIAPVTQAPRPHACLPVHPSVITSGPINPLMCENTMQNRKCFFLGGTVSVALSAALLSACGGGGDGTPTTSSSCTVGTACVTDTDCGTGTRCSNDQCTKIYCLADGSSCSTNDVCASKTCVLTKSLSEPNVCMQPDAPRPEGTECSSQAPCVTGILCNTHDGWCVAPGSITQSQPCSDSAQCITGLVCNCGQGHNCSAPSGYGALCCSNSDCQSLNCQRDSTDVYSNSHCL